MTTRDDTTSYTVEQTPKQVFAAVKTCAAGGRPKSTARPIVSAASSPIAKGTFIASRAEDHRALAGPKGRVARPRRANQRRQGQGGVSWSLTSAETELRFTHVGLEPSIERYGKCAPAWTFYINESLKSLITTGKGDPNAKKS